MFVINLIFAQVQAAYPVYRLNSTHLLPSLYKVMYMYILSSYRRLVFIYPLASGLLEHLS